MRISSKNGAKSVKNKSFDNQSVISSDYIFLKNGNVKRKRNKNSYFETFLEKRRMAAEFAQSKRCYSTLSTKIQNNCKNNINNNSKPKNQILYPGMQEIININKLKHYLPGKATSIIDNTENIIKSNNNEILKSDEINKINFLQKNKESINKNNDSLSQPYFDEIRHLTNKSNANNEINNNLIPPIELDNDNNEETSKFGNEGKIIDTNKSRKIEMIPEKHFEIMNKNRYNKLKNSVNTYVKKRPVRDDYNKVSALLQNKNNDVNSNNNPVNISVSFRNDFNKNDANNNLNKTNLNNKNNKNNNQNIYDNINLNDFSIKYNDKNSKDMNRYVETINNEENDNNLNFFKVNDNNNEKAIDKEIKSNNKEINNINDMKNNNINNNENNANNTNDTNQNDISNDIIEETNVIKLYEDASTKKEIPLLIDNNIKNDLKIKNKINDIDKTNTFKKIEETTKNSIKVNKININEKEKIDISETIDDNKNQNENKNKSIKNYNKKNNNKNTIIFQNYEKVNNNNIYYINNSDIYNKNNTENNLYPSTTKNKIIKKNDKDKNYYSLMLNKDIERLNKLKQSSQRGKQANYFYEIDDFIENIKKQRDNRNNEYQNLTKENRDKLIKLQNQKKDLKLFQNQINSALNYNQNKISFHSTKNSNNIQNNIYFNNINGNKNKNNYKVKMSSRMQGLLNKLEKEKISNNIEKNENSSNDIIEKPIFTQNVINSINNSIDNENSRIISNENNINNNKHSHNFILLENYYNNENNYINNRKNKKNKSNFFNYVSFDDNKKTKDRNIVSYKGNNNKNKNSQMNNNDMNILNEKIYKLIKTKNNRISKSKPNLDLNLNTQKRLSFLKDEKYNLFSNNSKKMEKSSNFIDANLFLDKLKDDLHTINKSSDIDLFKSKSKRNWNSNDYFELNNNINSDINIMPVNNIKSLFHLNF